MNFRTAARFTDYTIAVALFSSAFLWSLLLYASHLYLYGDRFFDLPSGKITNDFAFFWGGARLFISHRPEWIFHPEQFNSWLAGQIAPGSMPLYSTWSYPPTTLLLMLPFGLLPLPLAMMFWIAITFMCLILALRLALASKLEILAVLMSPAAIFTLHTAQNGALTAAFIVMGVSMVDRRPILSGICIGLLVVKPQLGIIFPFALASGGYWRSFLSASVTFLSVSFLSFIIFGFSAWSDFITVTSPFMTTQLLHDYGIPPQVAMPTIWVTLQGWGASIQVAAAAQAVTTLMAIIFTVRVWRSPSADKNLRNMLTFTLCIVATPYAYLYDLLPVIFAIVFVVKTGFSTTFALSYRIIIPMLWIWPAVVFVWASFGLRPIGGFLVVAFAIRLFWSVEHNRLASGDTVVPEQFATPSVPRT